MQDFDTLMSAIMPVENDPDPDSIYRKFWQERDQYTVQIAWRVCIAIHPRIVGYKFYQTMLNWDVRFAVATEKEYRNMLMKQRALAPAGVRSAFKPVKQIMANRRFFPLAICEGTGKRIVVSGHLPPQGAHPADVVSWMNGLVERSRAALPNPAERAALRDSLRREIIVCDGVEISFDAFADVHEGRRVLLRRHFKDKELNGAAGTVVKAASVRTGRAKVRLDSGRVVAVKVGNLDVSKPSSLTPWTPAYAS